MIATGQCADRATDAAVQPSSLEPSSLRANCPTPTDPTQSISAAHDSSTKVASTGPRITAESTRTGFPVASTAAFAARNAVSANSTSRPMSSEAASMT